MAKPEERVRQALLRWLGGMVKAPASLIAVEYSLSALDKTCRKRADVVVWRPGGDGLRPWLLCECKAPGIALSDKTADQVRGYAEKIKAEFVLLTNGMETRYFKLQPDRYEEIARLPLFPR